MDAQAVLGVCLGLTILTQAFSNCIYENANQDDHPAMKRLEALNGKRYAVSDEDADGYNYQIGICTSASDPPQTSADAGVIQMKKGRKEKAPPIIVGSINHTRIVGGTDWLFLEYRGGKKYHRCNQTARMAQIMITCTPGETQGKLRVIEENNKRSSDCYYLFEMDHDAACPENPKAVSHGLSVGSVLCIVVFVVIAVYLLAGAAYQRFIVGAKGMEQIPNYTFWQDFGNLQADGCDFLCRRGQTRGSRGYRGIGDDQLNGDQEEDIGRDDSLLPM